MFTLFPCFYMLILQYIYVYMYIYIYVYMYICMCICVYMYICIYVYMYICIYVYMCICVYVYMYICIYICMYICMYIYDGGIINGQQLYNNRSGYTTTTRTPSLEMTGTVVVILKWLCFSEGCLTKLYSHMYIYIYIIFGWLLYRSNDC